jgi:outer membrane protein OmpA-like peptidoglycan-associated protein
MTRLWHTAVVCAALAAACGPRSAPPTPGGVELIVLTADPAGGDSGRASVTNPLGTIELTSAGAAANIVSGRAPVQSAMSDADVARVFGDAMASLPLAPQSSVLYFLFESDALTPESAALLPKVLEAVVSRPAPEVLIVGHTDTTGDQASNLTLGLNRATAVRTLLLGAGLDPALLDVTSHGESALLVATADETPEPRNRRVEITVR